MFVVDFLFRVLIALFSDQLASLSDLSASPLFFRKLLLLMVIAYGVLSDLLPCASVRKHDLIRIYILEFIN